MTHSTKAYTRLTAVSIKSTLTRDRETCQENGIDILAVYPISCAVKVGRKLLVEVKTFSAPAGAANRPQLRRKENV